MDLPIVLLVILTVVLLVLSPRSRMAITSIILWAALAGVIATGLYAISNPEERVNVLSISASIILSSAVISVLINVVGVVLEYKNPIQDWLEERFNKTPPAELRRAFKMNGPALVVNHSMKTDLVDTTARTYPDISLLSDNRYEIRLSGEINEHMVILFKSRCRSALAAGRHRPIRIELNSAGGDVAAVMEIRRMVAELANQRYVEVLVTGYCYSAAVFIVTQLPVERRLSLSSAQFLVHTAKNSGDTDNEATIISNEVLIRLLSTEACVDEASMRKLYNSQQDYFCDAAKALELGIIGHILPDINP